MKSRKIYSSGTLSFQYVFQCKVVQLVVDLLELHHRLSVDLLLPLPHPLLLIRLLLGPPPSHGEVVHGPLGLKIFAWGKMLELVETAQRFIDEITTFSITTLTFNPFVPRYLIANQL